MRGRMLVVGVVVVVGFLIYLRLWSIDSEYSHLEDTRRQFDFANKEAMEESAEWRYKYDLQLQTATNCAKVKEGLEKKMMEMAIEKNKLHKVKEGLEKKMMEMAIEKNKIHKVKEGLEKKMMEMAIEKNKLHKENVELLERIDSLTQELQTLKHNTSSL